MTKQLTKQQAFLQGRDLRILKLDRLELVITSNRTNPITFNVRSVQHSTHRSPEVTFSEEPLLRAVPGSVATNFVEGYLSLNLGEVERIRKEYLSRVEDAKQECLEKHSPLRNK